MRRLRLQRHRLRARRVRSWTGWQPGELHVHMRAESVPLPPWQRELLLRYIAARRINPNTVVALMPPQHPGPPRGILGAIQRDLAEYFDGEQGTGSW